MKKIVIISATLIVVVVGVFVLLKNIDFSKEIIVGTAPTMAPFTYLDEAGEIVGFDIALVHEIAKDKNRPAKVQFMYFSQLINALQKGDIDMIACLLTITEERKRLVDFSDPYYLHEVVAIIHKDRLQEFEGVTTRQELGRNRKIAAQTGTLLIDFIIEIANDQNNIIRSGTWDDSALALIDGAVDVVILNEVLSRKYLQLHDEIMILPITNMWQLECAFAVKKGNDKLRKSINDTIERLKNSGEYLQLVHKYIESYIAE